MCALLIYFPPQIAWEMTVRSFYDIMIICSTLLVGKPLCMQKGNAIIHLCICQHCHQNPYLLLLHLNHIVFSLSWIMCLWHIYWHSCLMLMWTHWHMWHLRGILVLDTYMAITCFLSHDADGAISDTIAFMMLRWFRGITWLLVPMQILLASVSC